jgi:hypothetical protein
MRIRRGMFPPPHESLEVRTADVSPRYFATLGIPITEGRDFTRSSPGFSVVSTLGSAIRIMKESRADVQLSK